MVYWGQVAVRRRQCPGSSGWAATPLAAARSPYAMSQPASTTPATKLQIADALRKWIDKNEQGLNGWDGVGMIPIRIMFDMNANNGKGSVKVQLGV